MSYIYEILPNLGFYLLLAVSFNLVIFVPAFIFKTDKLTDISYSLTFIFLSLVALFREGEGYFGETLIFIMVLFWALRLGGYLLYRISRTGKDSRFDKMRNSFLKFGLFWLIQGITVWAVMIPALLFFISNNLIGNNEVKIVIISLGFAVWLFGLIIETIADIQKFKYIEESRVQGKERHWVDVGLWKYSRHPNYFGEIIVWIGIYIVVITRVTLATSVLALIGPIFITVLICCFSGIPILEKKANKRYADNEDYEEYKNNTGLIIPGFLTK
jgi:steroid 5-alpha reductase family enzyme